MAATHGDDLPKDHPPRFVRGEPTSELAVFLFGDGGQSCSLHPPLGISILQNLNVTNYRHAPPPPPPPQKKQPKKNKQTCFCPILLMQLFFSYLNLFSVSLSWVTLPWGRYSVAVLSFHLIPRAVTTPLIM